MIALRSVRGWVAVLVLLLAAGAGAEGLDDLKTTTPSERAAAQTAMMKEKLGLTEAQAPKIAAINEKYAEQMDPIIKGSDGMFMKMRAVKEVEDRKETELKGVLSDDQFQQFQAMKSEMKDNLMQRIEAQRAQKGK
jgi:hypothetical protein